MKTISIPKFKRDPKLDTETITQELIDYITKKIVDNIQPDKVILFGSYARGDYTNNSDIDLFIIKDGDESGSITRRKIEALLWGRCFGLDLFVRQTEDVVRNVKANNTFYTKDIFKDGILLYDKSREIKSDN